MTTLEEVLNIQNQYAVLQAPTDVSSVKSHVDGIQVLATAATPSTVQVALVNNTTSSNVYACVSGLDVNRNGAVFLLQSDGHSTYYPTSPANVGADLAVDVNIKLGPPGSTTTITLPQAAGGRFWFCKETKLVFHLNPGPALVEPSSSNTSDPNYYSDWGFCEFTFNTFQLFVNITYVDFVSIPIALKLDSTTGASYEVKGMSSTGLDSVCSQLIAQSSRDGAGWKDLVVTKPAGGNLRALSPDKGIVMNNSLFNGYFQPYVNAVWAKYASTPLQIDTQVQWGVQSGTVVNGALNFPGVGTVTQPSAADIFSCNTGPFAQNQGEIGNICARICAGFNRSTLLINSNQPTGELVSRYYQESVTNHYSRIVHSVNDAGKGYAFAYDDVAPSDDANVAGTVADSNPKMLTITLGGTNVSARAVGTREMARSGGRSSQLVGGRRIRRALDWASAEDEKALLAQRDSGVEEMRHVPFADETADLEMGAAKLDGEVARLATPQPPAAVLARSLQSLVPAAVQDKMMALLERVESSAAYAYAKPAVDAVVKAVILVLSLSVKTVVSRFVMVAFLLLCSFLLGFFGRGSDAPQVFVDAVDASS